MIQSRQVLLPGLLVVLALTAGFGVTAGVAAACSALGGGIAAIVLLASTPVVLGPIATALPGFSLAAAISFYLTKIGVLAVALTVLSEPARREAVDLTALGLSVIVTVLAWTFLLVVAHVRARQPVYDLPDRAP